MIAFRGDVEGLRAVAVLLVVLDHLEVPGFRGGFMGVDVFFVISGYLITSLLAAECAKKAEAHGGRGSISIPGFYARRARRILPAALTVIVAVVVAGGVLLNELRVAQIRHDAVWAALFGSNVNFIRQATDYSTQGLVDSSPFQHYWSLAVEEQFYLVWPALFLLVTSLTFLGGTVRWRARVAIAVCAIAAASLAWSIVATERGPVGAYFSTFTRAWELALGALIGITTTSATRFPRPLARAASVAGVALFVAAAVVISDTTPFPGAVALLPTAATALLIVGGITERFPFPNRALCLSPLRFLGRISYSVYLWHWPLVVFAVALYPTVSRTVQMRLLILLVTLAVATLSYYLVERPGRRIGVHGRPDRAPARPPRRGRNLVATTVGAFALAAVFVGVVSAIEPERSTAIPVNAAIVSQPAKPSLFLVGAERTPAETDAVREDAPFLAARDPCRPRVAAAAAVAPAALAAPLDGLPAPLHAQAPGSRGRRMRRREPSRHTRGSAERGLARGDASQRRLARVRPGDVEHSHLRVVRMRLGRRGERDDVRGGVPPTPDRDAREDPRASPRRAPAERAPRRDGAPVARRYRIEPGSVQACSREDDRDRPHAAGTALE